MKEREGLLALIMSILIKWKSNTDAVVPPVDYRLNRRGPRHLRSHSASRGQDIDHDMMIMDKRWRAPSFNQQQDEFSSDPCTCKPISQITAQLPENQIFFHAMRNVILAFAVRFLYEILITLRQVNNRSSRRGERHAD